MTIPWRNCRNDCLGRLTGQTSPGRSKLPEATSGKPGTSEIAVIAVIAGLSDEASRFTRHSLPACPT